MVHDDAVASSHHFEQTCGITRGQHVTPKHASSEYSFTATKLEMFGQRLCEFAATLAKGLNISRSGIIRVTSGTETQMAMRIVQKPICMVSLFASQGWNGCCLHFVHIVFPVPPADFTLVHIF
jgi:hypothetical protein